MYYMKLFGKIHIFLFLFTCYAWCSTGVQLLSERHRTEWNWVEYRITLVNTSELPILNPEMLCNTPENPNTNPEGSCTQSGYVCNLDIDVNNKVNVMFFNLGTDTSCTNLLESRFNTFLTGQDSITTDFATFFFMDDNDSIDALSMTLVSSVAMLSVNNDVQVEIIYKQHGEQWYGGIRLLSIKLRNTLNP